MIKIENVCITGFEPALRGMRNPLDSWARSDSRYEDGEYVIGPNDFDLAKRLFDAGPVHRKYLRMIHFTADITAPMYWWKEYDTYKVSTVANSCSTMHKLGSRHLTKEDFSTDETIEGIELLLQPKINMLNLLMDKMKEEKDEVEKKKIWRAVIMMLPMNYNQKRTVDISYETIMNMIQWRENHKLIEWRQLVQFFKTLPLLNRLLEGKDKDDEGHTVQ